MSNLPTPPLQTDNKNSLPLIIFGIILALGLIAAAFVLGTQFKNLKQSGTITVKGLAEAPYKANLAQIQMGVSAWGQDYAGALANGKNDFKALQQFVASKGFSISSQNVTPIVSPRPSHLFHRKLKRDNVHDFQ